jgi:hypothetical protein
MRRFSVVSLVTAVLMAVPSASGAQGIPSDPEADSPSGVVYEIPVERARKDAAPRRGTAKSPGGDDGEQSSGGETGGSGSSGGTGGPGTTSDTSIRSENNFGTSSKVPGAGPAGGRDGNAQSSDGEGGRSAGDVASSTARLAGTNAEGPSEDVVFPLLVVLLVAGAGIGIFAGRRQFGGRGGN